MDPNKLAPLPRERSPRYPAVGLRSALLRAKSLNDAASGQAVTIEFALEKWGYRPGSSLGQQTVAALRQYGLIENDGARDRRTVKLTPLALKLLEGGLGTERGELRVAALLPLLHREIWNRFGGQLPSDDVLREYLISQRAAGKFNHQRVDRFLQQFRETLLYSQLPPEHLGKQESREANTLQNQNEGIPSRDVSSDVIEHRTYEIRLGDNRLATIRVPIPISNDEFERIVTTLANLKGELVRPVDLPETTAEVPAEPAPSLGRRLRRLEF